MNLFPRGHPGNQKSQIPASHASWGRWLWDGDEDRIRGERCEWNWKQMRWANIRILTNGLPASPVDCDDDDDASLSWEEDIEEHEVVCDDEGVCREGATTEEEYAAADARTGTAHVALLDPGLRGGEVLYIPPLWFHSVRSEVGSISANVWSLSTEISAFENALSTGLPDALSLSELDDAAVAREKGLNVDALKVDDLAPWSLVRVPATKLRVLRVLIGLVLMKVLPPPNPARIGEDTTSHPLHHLAEWARRALYMSRYAPVAAQLACPPSAAAARLRGDGARARSAPGCAMNSFELGTLSLKLNLSVYAENVARALRPACDTSARADEVEVRRRSAANPTAAVVDSGCDTIVANWIEEVLNAVIGPMRACTFVTHCMLSGTAPDLDFYGTA